MNYLSDSCKNDDIKKYTEKKQQIQIQKSVVRDHTVCLFVYSACTVLHMHTAMAVTCRGVSGACLQRMLLDLDED